MKIRNVVFFTVLIGLIFFLAAQLKNYRTVFFTTKVEQKTSLEDFITTFEEQKELSKWDGASLEIVVQHCETDRSASYILGQHASVIKDHSGTLLFFSLSANLGFAPALHKLSLLFLKGEMLSSFKFSSELLGLTYLNLVIAKGHPEFNDLYQNLRNKFMQRYSRIDFANPEKLAAKKMSLILKNQEGLKTASNKKEFTPVHILEEDLQYERDMLEALDLVPTQKSNQS